jgi:hypothetical protein
VKKKIAIVFLVVVMVLFGRGIFYYTGLYSPPPSEVPRYGHIVVPPAPLGEFADNISVEEGAVLIDLAHDNNFDLAELNVLLARLVSRGLTIRLLGVEDDLGEELLGEERGKEDEEELIEAEEKADQSENVSDGENGGADPGEETLDEEEKELPGTFIVVSPREEFSKEDKETTVEFIDNGGKLLLIADPTRRSEINSLSLSFGLIFESDYLYNMRQNEINYRNIFVREFTENEVTKNLGKIALYTTGSISSAGGGIAFVDWNTYSSVIETVKRLSPLALAQDSKVLAVHDLTFMTEPYNGVLDNNQLISNIADWLVSPIEEKAEQ